MKRLIAALLVLAAIGVRHTSAQDSAAQPVLVVSANSYDGFVANLKYVGTVLSDAQYLNKLAKLSTLLTQQDAIKIEEATGIDGQKPAGIAIYSDGQSIRQLSFLPVTDADAVLTWLKPLVGEVTKSDDGIYQIASPKLTAFAKVDNGWMFLATSAAQLANLPDPVAAVDDLPSKYDFAVRANFAKVPEEVRTLVIDQMRARLEATPPAGDASEADATFRRETTALIGRMFDRFANESEHVTLGVNLLEETTQLATQVVIKPLAGSNLAAHFAELGLQKTRFGGVFANPDKATLALGMTGKLAPESAGDIKSELEAYRTVTASILDSSTDLQSDEVRQLYKDLGGAVIDSMQAAAAAGKLDLALKVASGNPSTFVAAVQIVGGEAILAQLDRLAAATKDDPNSGFQADEATQAEVRIHSFVMPTGGDFAATEKSFGKGKLYLAANEETLYVAFGGKALDLLKEAIDAPAQEGVTPLRVAGKGVGMLRLMPQPSGGGQNAQLINSIVSLQLSTGDGFAVVGQINDGDLVIDATFEKGFIRLGGFAVPLVGQLLLPTLDLNNLGGSFGF